MTAEAQAIGAPWTASAMARSRLKRSGFAMILPDLLPLTGAHPSVLRESLQRILNDMSIVSSKAVDSYNEYNFWANNAIGRLQGLVDPDGLDRLISSRRYWALQGVDPVAHGGVERLINLELDDRRRVLQGSIDDLTRTAAAWDRLVGPIFVFDTNIYMHSQEVFPAFDFVDMLDVPNPAILTIAVPIVVINELDKGKRQQRNATVSDTDKTSVRTRCRQVLRNLEKLVPTSGSDAVQVPMHKDEVSIVVLTDPPRHVPLGDPDGELIDRSVALQSFAGRLVTVVSDDLGLRVRATAAGLKVWSG